MTRPDTTLVLVRHGVTDWNHARRFQGQTDIALNEEGLRQAELTGRRLAADPQRDRITAVYTSDLSRTAQTAAPIAAALGRAAQPEPGLRERHYGSFEGLTHDELTHGAFAADFRRWRAREPDFELPGGGETLRAFDDRVGRTLASLAARHRGAVVVAVTHGGVLDCAYRIAAGVSLDAPRRHTLLNASLNWIVFDGERFRLNGWGDVAHLSEALDDIEARD